MFFIFTAAVLLVTSAVALVALVGTWWMLGFAFAIHVLMTSVVVMTIVWVMDGRTGTSTARARADARRGEDCMPTRAKPAGTLL
jgi:membrane protein implicated in regulation of membrane protease activity